MYMFCLAELTLLDSRTQIVALPPQHCLNRYLAIYQRGNGRFAKAS